jgi:hypothetical protein
MEGELVCWVLYFRTCFFLNHCDKHKTLRLSRGHGFQELPSWLCQLGNVASKRACTESCKLGQRGLMQMDNTAIFLYLLPCQAVASTLATFT